MRVCACTCECMMHACVRVPARERACVRVRTCAFACVRVRPYPSVFRHVYVCVYLRCMHACACLRASEHARARPRACTRAFVCGRAREHAGVCVRACERACRVCLWALLSLASVWAGDVPELHPIEYTRSNLRLWQILSVKNYSVLCPLTLPLVSLQPLPVIPSTGDPATQHLSATSV